MRNFNHHIGALLLGCTLAMLFGAAGAADEVVGPPEPVPTRTQANPQTANTAPSFFVGGKVTTAFGSGQAEARSVVVQPDGKIVAGGWVNTGSGFVLALSRYLPDGRLDNGFGDAGRVTTVTNISCNNLAYSLGLQSNGKIVVAVEGCPSVVARYLPDGSLDSQFGSGGIVTLGFREYSFGYSGRSIAIQPDDKILIGGSGDNTLYGGTWEFTLVRLLVDGQLDNTFGVGGYATTDFGSNDQANAVLLQPDGKIVMTGQSNNGFAVARYLPNGALDTSFGTGGVAVSFPVNYWGAYGGRAGALQADGKILVAGTTRTNGSWGNSRDGMAVVRYLANGKLDTGFGANGLATINVSGWSSDYGQAVIQQPDGNIVIAGHSLFYGDDFAAARLLADGSLDGDFGGGGLVLTDFGANENAYGLAQQADGRLLAVGTTNSNNDYAFALSRYHPGGALDASFGEPADSLALPRTLVEQWENSLAPLALVLDAELAAAGTYDGANLILRRRGGANTEDQFSNRDGLTNLLPGSYFAIDSVTIGRVIANSGGTLQLRFMGANANQARVDKAMQLIAYRNSSDRPPAQVLIDWTFDDGNTGAQGTGGALSTTGTVTVNITPQNDGPQLMNPPPGQTAVAGSAFSYTLPANTFNDPDGDSLNWSLTMADGTGMPLWLNFNPATRVLSGTPSEYDIGPLNLRVTVTDPANATASTNFSLIVRAGLLSGLAAQGYVGINNQVQFGAFTISGDSRRVLIRGLGPTLDKYLDGAIRNPKIALSVNGASEPLITNDDWGQAENAAEIESLKHEPANAVESAILTTLPPGVYNLHLSGSGGSTGIGMFQIYAIEGGGNGELRGLAAQGQVGTDNQVQFGTFTITGNAQRVLIRGLGPTLNGYITGAIGNPKIALSVNGAEQPIVTNDDWGLADNASEIAELHHQPAYPEESAILTTLQPGVYNIHLSGSGGTTGIGMFQVYTVE
jgi:uncharacterized delta-60 repeat protein